MSLIILNLREMWKRQRLFLLLLVLVQAVGAFCMLFIVGVIINNQLLTQQEPVWDYVGIDLGGEGALPVTYREIEETILELFEGPLRSAGKDIRIHAKNYPEEDLKKYGLENSYFMIWTEVGIENGKYVPGSYFMEPTLGMQLKSGRNFTEEELNGTEYKAIIVSWPYEKVIVNGEKYEVIGERYAYGGLMGLQAAAIVPPKCMLDLEIFNIGIRLKRFLTEDEFGQITEALDAVIPGRYELSFQEDYYKEDVRASWKGAILSCVLIGVVMAGTLAMLYLHILDKRNYKLAVLRLVGGSAWRSLRLLLGEMLLLAVPSVALGMAVFYPLQRSRLELLYPYMETYLNKAMYGKIFLGLLAFLLVFLFVIAAVKTLVSVKQQLLSARR